MVSVGVKVTLWAAVPAAGTVLGEVKAKAPATEAEPPLSVDEDSVWPYVMALAVGHAVTFGVTMPTVTCTVPVTVV